MKRKATNLLLPSLLLALAFVSCKRRCASPDGTGLNVWLGKDQIIAPSAFTPGNGDGVNDTFGFYLVSEPVSGPGDQGLIQKVKDMGFEVRRGGTLLFETHGWGNTWNGRSSSGKLVDGLVDVEYSISDFDGNVSEGTFKLFVVPVSDCLQDCMHSHTFGDMIDPYQGAVNPTKEQFCQ